MHMYVQTFLLVMATCCINTAMADVQKSAKVVTKEASVVHVQKNISKKKFGGEHRFRKK